MNVSKFIASNMLRDYNKIIQMELNFFKNKKTIELKEHSKKNDINDEFVKNSEHKYLYKLSECDFFDHDILYSLKNNTNIADFEKNYINNKYHSKKNSILAYNGALIKMHFDPNYIVNNKKIKFKKIFIVHVLSHKYKVFDIFNDDAKQNISQCGGHYIVELNDTIFLIDKNTYNDEISCILRMDNYLDRLLYYSDEILMSGMFILELYKKLSCYDINNCDPIYDYPEEIFDIYDKSFNQKKSIKRLIDIVDVELLSQLNKNVIENTIIQMENDNKYTVLEYLIIKIMENTNIQIHGYLYNFLISIASYNFLRPIFFIARLYGFDKKYSELYDILLENKHVIDIDPTIDISGLETVHHFDLYILKHLIQLDQCEIFINYLVEIDIARKFTTKSKTGDKIILWLIEFKATNIIRGLFDYLKLCDEYKYKLIFLTQDFTIPNHDFFNKYLFDDSAQRVKIINKKELKEYNESKEQDKKITDSRIIIDDINVMNTINEMNTNVTNINSNINDQMIINQIDNFIDHNMIDYDVENKVKSIDNSYDYVQKNIYNNFIDEFGMDNIKIILSLLPNIINNGLMQSFCILVKLFPFILDSHYDVYLVKKTHNVQNNILHAINNDNAVNILDIILRMNIKLIDIKNEIGVTPLIKYSELNLSKCIYKLLEYNCDIELVDNRLDTFLHKLCENGNVNIIKLIIENVQYIINYKNIDMMTPIMIATINGHEEIFHILYNYSADLSLCDIYGNTVYHYICKSKLCLGATIINKKNKFGFTPYDYCNIHSKFYCFVN